MDQGPSGKGPSALKSVQRLAKLEMNFRSKLTIETVEFITKITKMKVNSIFVAIHHLQEAVFLEKGIREVQDRL